MGMEEKIKSKSSTKTLLQGIKDVVKPNREGEQSITISEQSPSEPETSKTEHKMSTNKNSAKKFTKKKVGKKSSSKPSPKPESSHLMSDSDISDQGDHRRRNSGIRKDSLKTEMLKDVPPEGTVLRLMGPYGAPAQSMWHFKTVMLVGTGIGVTPFAAMLRSVNIRLDQRKKVAKVLSNKKEKLGNYEDKQGLQNLVI